MWKRHRTQKNIAHRNSASLQEGDGDRDKRQGCNRKAEQTCQGKESLSGFKLRSSTSRFAFPKFLWRQWSSGGGGWEGRQICREEHLGVLSARHWMQQYLPLFQNTAPLSHLIESAFKKKVRVFKAHFSYTFTCTYRNTY